ncbi:MFS family permease [Actinokineospora baliensis]|uniref:MFS transporter n=1 Tax=Actinokineospora baliensis TaxID=547056 RepID=UPI001955FD47|nr:MFS transporter [Actinokineospora baliensis]MBM7773852.1 MFS family permease [Actinokineospora baliensis]
MAEQNAPRRLTRDRDFLRFWGGETVSLAGAQVAELGLLLVAVITLSAGPLEIGLFNVARYSPILVSLLVGVWFDRHRRRRALIAANLGRAALVALVPLAAATGTLTIGLLYAIGFLLGLLTVVFDVGSLSYVPSLVEPTQLAEANGRIQTSYSVAGIAGPGLAGALVGLLTAPFALLVTTGSYLVSALSMTHIRKPEPPPPPPEPGVGTRAMIAEGIRAVFGDRVLRNLATQSATFNLFENVVTTLFAVYAVRELGLSAGQLGFVIGAGAVGALIGAVTCARLTLGVGLGRVLLLATLLGCASPLALIAPGDAQPAALAVLAVGLAVHGYALAVFNVNALTLRQCVTPARLLGRMNASYRLLLFGTIPLGALLGGALAAAFGLRTGLVLGVVGLMLPMAWVLFSPVYRLRAMPAPQPEPPAVASDPGREPATEGKDRETGYVV